MGELFAALNLQIHLIAINGVLVFLVHEEEMKRMGGWRKSLIRGIFGMKHFIFFFDVTVEVGRLTELLKISTKEPKKLRMGIKIPIYKKMGTNIQL